ncbi:MAG: hypothetical protein ABL901_00740 [Hyphomicrobiaceae bacterium]
MIPSVEARILWTADLRPGDVPRVAVVRPAEHDTVTAAWGNPLVLWDGVGCMGWSDATDDQRQRWLLELFHSLVLIHNVPPDAVNAAFSQIGGWPSDRKGNARTWTSHEPHSTKV